MSHQVVQLIPHSRPTLLAARRILVAAALVATGYLVAVIAPAPLDFFHTVASGSAADAKEHGTPASARSLVAPPSEASTPASVQRDFDYFPDHYRNQGKDADENIPTF
jgi:ABC-type sugar transport system substrate-binding protein